MNIDPEKVKELVLIYSELNEDYQKELLKQAYILQLKQSQLNLIQKEKKTFKTDMELQEEVDKRSYECAKEARDLLDVMKKIDSTDKAALFMLINQLAGKGNVVQESDITITINQKNISMREYLDKYLSGANFEQARSMTDKYLKEVDEIKTAKGGC